MAGRGPAPKTDDSRARRNKDNPSFTQVATQRAAQPSLESLLGAYNPLTGEEWTHGTLLLWEQLDDFPTTAMLQAAQWSSLARAMMHDDAMLRGVNSSSSEARQRLAKFGIDPDDLLRLRIQLISANEAEAEHNDKQKRRAETQSAYGNLRAIDMGETA